MAEFELEVLQPERVFFKDKVEMIVLRTIDGEIGIMANHQPIVVPIGIGKLRIKKMESGEKQPLLVVCLR